MHSGFWQCSLANVLRDTAASACKLSSITSESRVPCSCLASLTCKRVTRHSDVHFLEMEILTCKSGQNPAVSCYVLLANALFATVARTLPRVVRDRQLFISLTCKRASRCSGVQFLQTMELYGILCDSYQSCWHFFFSDISFERLPAATFHKLDVWLPNYLWLPPTSYSDLRPTTTHFQAWFATIKHD